MQELGLFPRVLFHSTCHFLYHFGTYRTKYSLMPNRMGTGIMGSWKNPQNLISGGGGWKKQGGGKLTKV